MKTMKISLRTIQAAVNRGRSVQDAWAKAGYSNEWMAKVIEVARIPAVSRRMREKQRKERLGCPDYYGDPAPVTDIEHHLPGYVMRGWSSGPREGWELAHAPSNTWNGMYRELYVSLPEHLRMLATEGQECVVDLDRVRSFLREIWKVEVNG